MVYSLVPMYFDRPQLGTQFKQTVKNIWLLIQRYVNFDFLEKGLEIVSPPHPMYDFSRKKVSHVDSIN